MGGTISNGVFPRKWRPRPPLPGGLRGGRGEGGPGLNRGKGLSNFVALVTLHIKVR